MALPNDIIIEIFEYLEFPQILKFQYLSKSLRKLMKEHRWNQIFYHKNLTDDVLINIIKTWNICKINLSGCCDNLNNKSLKQLGNMEYISLRECYFLFDNIVEKFKNVKYLDLGGCKNITNKCVKELKNVKELNLYNCWHISDNGIKCLKNIEKLNICGCSNITDDGIIGLKKLKSLDIDKYYYNQCDCPITDECLGILEKRGVLITYHL